MDVDDSALEWVQAISTLIATVVIPVVVVVIGNRLSASVRERETDRRLIEIAVEVLKDVPRPEGHQEALRDWAVDVINRYSDVPLSDQAKEHLVRLPLTGERLFDWQKDYYARFYGAPSQSEPR